MYYNDVNNLPENFDQFVVARDIDGELWFWGSWDNDTDAANVANKVNGVVVKMWG